MKKSQDQTNANKKASERNPYYLRKSKMMFKKKRDIRLSQHSERKKRNKVFEQETKERAKIRERKKNIIGEKKKRDRRRRRRYTCIGKVRPAVSSCDVTQAPCGRLENGDGQVDNASNPLVVSGFCFLIYLNIFFFFQCFCIHNIERTAINRLNFHKLEQTL